MSVTIGYRTLVGFVAGVAACVIALFMFQALRVDAAPGDADATFVAMTPCRLIDTRAIPDFHVGPHSTFGADDTKTVQARGTNGKCTIPTDAVGLSLNVTAVDATAPSFLTIWPDGARPNASSLNPVPGQPPTPNAVATNLSGVGSFNIFNLAGTVEVIVDVNGYYTKSSLQDLDARMNALETAGVSKSVLDRIDALESANTAQQSEIDSLESANTAQQAKIDALQTKTASMSVETVDGQPTVRFSNVNVQIVDGSGDTDGAINGRGNLIVGYNENSSDTRTGSHNLVVGDNHSYSSYGGVAFGANNTISGTYASVTGGVGNTASLGYASVSGGFSNTASGSFASVSGGNFNTASGDYASVSGGTANTASGLGSSVLSGDDGEARGVYAVVVGGSQNQATGPRAVAVGGGQNIASGSKAVLSGGSQRESAGVFDWRAGGLFQED